MKNTYTPAEIAELRREHRQRALTISRDMRQRGATLRQIAKALHEQGIAPPRGLPGQYWQNRTVLGLLRASSRVVVTATRSGERSGA